MNALCCHLGAERESVQGLHPKGQDRWPLIWSCQIAHSFSRQWPAPMAATIVILSLLEPKPNVSFLSLAPNPSLYILFPWFLLSLGDKRRGGLQMVETRCISYPYVALIYSFSKNLPEGIPCRNSLFDPIFFSLPLSCLKKRPCQRLTSCLRFFNDPVHSKFSSLSVPLLLGPPCLPSLPLARPTEPFCKARCVLPSPRNPGWLLQSLRLYPFLPLVKYCRALCSVVFFVLVLAPTGTWGKGWYLWCIYMHGTQWFINRLAEIPRCIHI